jgi:hypothetical protein
MADTRIRSQHRLNPPYDFLTQRHAADTPRLSPRNIAASRQRAFTFVTCVRF